MGFLIAAVLAAGSLWTVDAQFGGREDDVVIFALTSKGPGELRAVASTTVNSPASLAAFSVIDSKTVPVLGFGPDFADVFTRQVLHDEPDDLFQLVTQYEGPPGPHRYFLKTYKTFTIGGVVREIDRDIDFVPGILATLGQGIDFDADVAIDTFRALFWAELNQFPATRNLPPGQKGPAVPEGKTGVDVILDSAKLAAFIPWTPARTKYPNAGWPDGVDVKLLEEDPSNGSTVYLIRLRPGRRTPVFRIPGSTHFFVLEGSVEITPAGGRTLQMATEGYSFVPKDFAVSLYRPRTYSGPVK